MKDVFLCIKNVGLLTSLNWLAFPPEIEKIFEITLFLDHWLVSLNVTVIHSQGCLRFRYTFLS